MLAASLHETAPPPTELRSHVELMLAMRLVELAGAVPYRLMPPGALVLATETAHSSSA